MTRFRPETSPSHRFCIGLWGGDDPVGAALCRERAARRPQNFSFARKIAGAALRPFRDTRPLLQNTRQACRISESARCRCYARNRCGPGPGWECRSSR
ncbi:hypothetical protein CXG50_27165 [Pseudomonas plecoglossicida]|nr:hypothetical protein CX682_00530 [Pseudomonas sp. FFUP_PS_41]PLV00275.1 hypothetical protein CXG52_05005 [Pseudomonas plecoglossicida]PLV02241.1 hypothetical protein CXG50_27165 [Pseudomonas plecoglossicida]